MNKRLRLSEEQKKALSNLEPVLRKCVASADLEKAKEIEGKIQNLLEPTGHETRHLQAKNWLYETALEAGEISYAKLGLEETIQKSSPTTRLHLEAISLLAICHLRERDIEKAKVLIIDAGRKIYNIKSFWRQEQFYRRLITRLERESILVSLVDDVKRKLTVDEVNAETKKLVESKSQGQILLEMGNAVPRQLIDILSEADLLNIREEYRLREFAYDEWIPFSPLPPLPPPVNTDNKQELGKRTSVLSQK